MLGGHGPVGSDDVVRLCHGELHVVTALLVAVDVALSAFSEVVGVLELEVRCLFGLEHVCSYFQGIPFPHFLKGFHLQHRKDHPRAPQVLLHLVQLLFYVTDFRLRDEVVGVGTLGLEVCASVSLACVVVYHAHLGLLQVLYNVLYV